MDFRSRGRRTHYYYYHRQECYNNDYQEPPNFKRSLWFCIKRRGKFPTISSSARHSKHEKSLKPHSQKYMHIYMYSVVGIVVLWWSLLPIYFYFYDELAGWIRRSDNISHIHACMHGKIMFLLCLFVCNFS